MLYFSRENMGIFLLSIKFWDILALVGHLHAGNIVVEENRVKLLDVENWLLGLPSYYRCYFTQLKKVNVSAI